MHNENPSTSLLSSKMTEVVKAQAEQLASLAALVQRLTDQVQQHARTIAILRAEVESLRQSRKH